MFGRKGRKRIEVIESQDEEAEVLQTEGVSLDELGTAYAQAISNFSGSPHLTASEAESNGESSSEAHDEAGLVVEPLLDAPVVTESDAVSVTPERIIEALLFIGQRDNRPIYAVDFANVLRGVSESDVESMIERLNESYKKNHRAFEITKESGGYRFVLRRSLASVRDQFYGKVRETTLTQSAIDCLSLVAYQQGITKDQIETQWNQSAGATLNMLVRRGLLRVDNADEDGKQLRSNARYFTTDRFLELIGLDSLEDLPQTDDM